jgi:uncharacterized membrane protein
MRRFLLPLFVALLVGAAAFIAVTSTTLPERVASHFARGGQANGWMPRESYVVFILGAAVLVPAVLVTLLAWLPRVFPRAINLPNRAYWFEPTRRDATLKSLSAFAWSFGSALCVLIAGLHWAVVQANAANPPMLAEASVNALLAGFATTLCVWIVAWFLRFRRRRSR